jgi:hypothetical protein
VKPKYLSYACESKTRVEPTYMYQYGESSKIYQDKTEFGVGYVAQ